MSKKCCTDERAKNIPGVFHAVVVPVSRGNLGRSTVLQIVVTICPLVSLLRFDMHPTPTIILVRFEQVYTGKVKPFPGLQRSNDPRCPSRRTCFTAVENKERDRNYPAFDGPSQSSMIPQRKTLHACLLQQQNLNSVVIFPHEEQDRTQDWSLCFAFGIHAEVALLVNFR